MWTESQSCSLKLTFRMHFQLAKAERPNQEHDKAFKTVENWSSACCKPIFPTPTTKVPMKNLFYMLLLRLSLISWTSHIRGKKKKKDHTNVKEFRIITAALEVNIFFSWALKKFLFSHLEIFWLNNRVVRIDQKIFERYDILFLQKNHGSRLKWKIF